MVDRDDRGCVSVWVYSFGISIIMEVDKMKNYPNIEIESVDELKLKINKASCISEMNDLRWACVKHMNSGHPEVTKLWQDKYWRLKKCSACGRNI